MKRETSRPSVIPSVHGFSPGFAALGLEARLLATLDQLGYEEPTPIQRAAIPPLLAGKDVLGQAATGTGKTAAFALPLLQRLAQGATARPAALILVPTRELAVQVGDAVKRYGKELRVNVLTVYGGQAMGPQLHALRHGVDVVVATPGRALDHIRRQSLKLTQVRVVVLDEADEMLDMGFADDLDAILEQTPATKQTALFSATMPSRIKSIAQRHLTHPVEITIAKEPVKVGTTPRVQQTAYLVARPYRGAALVRVLDMAGPTSALVFCRTRVEVDDVTAMLNGRGYRAEALHGGMSQPHRDRVLQAFRAGQTNLLVATDVAARGLDIPRVSHVINFDLPSSAEIYIHRIGRTGRAGREGTAITILDPREERLLRSIERLTTANVTVAPVPSAADLLAVRFERAKAAVLEAMREHDLGRFRSTVQAMASSSDPVTIAAAALKLVFQAQGGDRVEPDVPPVPTGRPELDRAMSRRTDRPETRQRSEPSRLNERPAMGRPNRERPKEGMARIYVGTGHQAGIRPGDLVGALTNEAKVHSKVLGDIEIFDRFSLVEVPAAMVPKIIDRLGRGRIKGHRVPVRLFREERDVG
ncbi:MAG: DEAD/DEAH box helicase [Nitrospira sp.]|nr:DEAD/DEAH box helicase [Nitrospira sp.]MCP9441991.1 DEAD/DEAH box helicase [Nitrospira sp.]